VKNKLVQEFWVSFVEDRWEGLRQEAEKISLNGFTEVLKVCCVRDVMMRLVQKAKRGAVTASMCAL
jgi:23S rRNA G2445 N2-methylase RlmL